MQRGQKKGLAGFGVILGSTQDHVSRDRTRQRGTDLLAQGKALQPGTAPSGSRHCIRELHFDLRLIFTHCACEGTKQFTADDCWEAFVGRTIFIQVGSYNFS